ncbi:MAG: AI-2E family transporter [bacterium]|nr:AI-2E family transporter [bacterium]
MKVKIEIDTKTFIRFWLVIFGFLLVGAAIWLAKDALILLVISAFLALALNGPVAKITKILPGSKKNRAGATAVAYILIVAVIGVVGAFIVPTFIEQTSKFIAEVPQTIENLTAHNSGLRIFVEQNNLGGVINEVVNSLTQIANNFSSNLANILSGTLTSLLNFLVSLFLVLTLTFLMLVEGPSWMNKIWRLYSDKQRQKKHKRIATRMYRAVANYVNGQLTVSAISGLCGALAAAILSLMTGLPMNLAIPVGMILFLIGMIPMFGALIAGIIASILIALNTWYAGLIFICYFLIYQQIENSVISPLIQAKSNNLSALIIIISVTIGIYAAGLLGAFLSIPVAACVKILFEEFYLSRQKKRPEDDKNAIAKLLKSI